MARVFADRRDAGRALRSRSRLPRRPDAIVLAFPRGGVPVGFEVAQALGLPLDVLVVRKLGLPAQPELAMGAIASGGAVVLNDDVLRLLPAAATRWSGSRRREMLELVRRERAYRGDRDRHSTMRGPHLHRRRRRARDRRHDGGGLRAMKAAGAGAEWSPRCRWLSSEALGRVASIADEAACALVPRWFSAVGQWYERFDQTDDDEVRELLSRAGARPAADETGPRGNLAPS